MFRYVEQEQEARSMEDFDDNEGREGRKEYRGDDRVEIGKVLAVATLAAEKGECFVSLLEPPMDHERASHVMMSLI